MSSLESGTAYHFAEARAALARVEEATCEALLQEQAKLLDAQKELSAAQEAKAELEAKVEKLERKLENKRDEAQRLTEGIQDVVDKYEAKLDAKCKDNQDLHATIAQLEDTIKELDESGKQHIQRVPVVTKVEEPSPERELPKGKDRSPSYSRSRQPLRRRQQADRERLREKSPSSDRSCQGSHQRSRPRSQQQRSPQRKRRPSSERSRSAAARSEQGEKEWESKAKRDGSSNDSPLRNGNNRACGERWRQRSASRKGKWREKSRDRGVEGCERNGDGRDARRATRGRSSSRPRSRSRELWRSHRTSSKGKGKAKEQQLCIPYVNGNCQKGDKCWDHHPPEDDRNKLFESLKKKPCRWGADCRRADCIFKHPPRN